MNIDNAKASLEAIGFQANDKAINSLVAIFAMPYKYLYELDNRTKSISSFEKYKRLNVFCKKLFSTELKKTLLKIFNVDLNEVIMGDPTNLGIGLAMSVRGESKKTEKSLNKQVNNLMLHDYKNNDVAENIKRFANLANNIDYEKRKIMDRTKITYSFIFYFSIVQVYISDRLFLVKGKENYRLSPREITAIFLHELGHYFTILEYSAYYQYAGIYGNHILGNVTSSAKKILLSNSSSTPEKELESLDKLLLVMINDDKKKKMDTSELETLHKSYEKFKEFANKSKAGKVTFFDKFLKIYKFVMLLQYLDICFTLMKKIISNIANVAFLSLMSSLSSFLFIGIKNMWYDKFSYSGNEVYLGKRSKTMLERLADEFVVRMGLGKEFATGLNKITTLYNNNGIFIMTPVIFENEIIRNIYSILFKPLATAYSLCSVFTTIAIEGENTYEINRFDRLVQDQLVVFKDSKLPIKLKNKYIKDYEELKQTVDNINSIKIFNLPENVKKLLTTPIDLSLSSFQQIALGISSRELIKMIDSFDDLIANKAYYYSAKISSHFD